MNAGRLHTTIAANAPNTPTNVNKSAWQQDEDTRVSILDEFFGHQRRTPPEGGYAPVVVEDREALAAWVQTLPPLYRDAIACRAREESGYTGETTWEQVGQYAHGMDRLEAEQRERGALHTNAALQSAVYGYVRAALRHAQAVRDIIFSVDRRAHDLIGAGDAAIRDRAKAIAEDELAQLTVPTATTLDAPDALDRQKIVRHLAAAHDLYIIVDNREMTTAEADAAGIEWNYAPDVQRRLDPDWWTRQLRRQVTEACLLIGAHLQLVGAGRPARYCDAHVTGRWRDRRDAAKMWAEATVWESGDTELWMAEVLASKEAAKVAQVYGETLGMQALGERLGLVPLFWSVTLPGEWHPYPNPRYRRKDAPPHRWNGKSPAEARAQLMRDWAEYIKRLRGRTIVFGLRVTEAHEDGCPHIHVLGWVHPEDVDRVYKELRKFFGTGVRATLKRIRSDRKNSAKPATYLMHYIQKRIALEVAGEGKEDQGDREAHRAWTSAIRARQWDVIGAASGIQRSWQTVHNWRTLPDDARASRPMREAWEAMQAAKAARAAGEDSAPHWADALAALIGERRLAGEADEELVRVDLLDAEGNPILNRRTGQPRYRTVKRRSSVKPAVRNTYAERLNKYGEAIKTANGITDGRASVIKEREWTARQLTADEITARKLAKAPQGVAPDRAVVVVVSCPREAAAPPSTAPPGAAGQPSGRYDPKSEVIRLIKEREHLPQWQKWIQDRRQHWGLAEAA